MFTRFTQIHIMGMLLNCVRQLDSAVNNEIAKIPFFPSTLMSQLNFICECKIRKRISSHHSKIPRYSFNGFGRLSNSIRFSFVFVSRFICAALFLFARRFVSVDCCFCPFGRVFIYDLCAFGLTFCRNVLLVVVV